MSATTSTGARPPSEALLAWTPAVIVAFMFHVVWEGHGVIDPAFRNPDVAGIAYNARLLVEGGLPYVDSAEIKPPGAFLLFAPFLAAGGMRAVWGAAVVWGALLSLATGAVAAACWGKRYGPPAAMLHAAWAVLGSDGDINYSFWMALPFTLAAACACAAVSEYRPFRRRLAWAAAGALAMMAVSIKPSAWTLVILFGALGLTEVLRRRVREALEGALLGVAGAFAATAVIALPYLVAGELRAFWSGLESVSLFGNEYVGVVRDGRGGRWRAIWAGSICLMEQLPGPLAFAAAGCANLFARRPRAPLAPVAFAFTLSGLLGVAYTLRFFSHDNAQLLPALAVLAVRPAGLVAALLKELSRVPRVVAFAPAILGLAAGWPDYRPRRDFVNFMGERDHAIASLCERLAPVLPSNDPVLAWGWHGWSVYEHCGKRAPGRVFKVLAQVTTPNTNTCNAGFGPMKLRAGPEPAEFFAEVARRPPSLFLWTSYFDEMGGDPMRDFHELREFVDRHYTIVDVWGPFVAMLRRDLDTPSRLVNRERRPLDVLYGSGLYGWSGRAGSVCTSTSLTPANRSLMASITQ